MPAELKEIEFTPCGAKSVNIGKARILQLGLQSTKIDEKSPIKHRAWDYYLLRLASTFGKDGVTLKQGMLKITLLVEKTKNGCVVAHDMYPRSENEVSESEIEVGLDSKLTWAPISISPKLTYKTKIRKINNILVAGGVLTSHPWWRFEPRKGEKSIFGCMETLLTVQVSHATSFHGIAELTGQDSGWRRGNPPQASFNFKIE